MKRIPVLFFVLSLLAIVGCKPKPKEIPTLQRKEAANLVSEAQFALTMKDLARAEPLFEKAANLCPDTGEYWLGLGVTRRRLGNKAGAKAAYEKMREACHDAYVLNGNSPEAALQEVHALALLGRIDEARKVLEKARKKNPTNPQLRGFSEKNGIDQLIAEPEFKELAI
jgi:tetratricopeptide (TPR) repeat protein